MSLRLQQLAVMVWSAVAAIAVFPASAQDSDGIGIDEIVVTARKRVESLIDVPIAVTAVTAEQIAREGIKDVEGVIARDTSLDFDLGFAPYDTRIVIRGLSPTRGRPNVATLIDGIDVSSEAVGVAGGSLLINPRLVDIAQVEIVKGPQSALYGRSAFAGAISYTTLDPGSDVGGNLAVEYTNHDLMELKAGLALPVNDSLGFRVNGYLFRDEGFYRNAVTNGKIGGGDGKGASLTAKWTPGDTYTLKFRTEYADDHFNLPPQALLPFNSVSVVPASASNCLLGTNASGMAASVGVIRDATCAATPAIEALGLHAARELERLTGGTGAFNDMLIPAFRGSVGDASDRGLRPAFSANNARATLGVAPNFNGSDRQVFRVSAVQSINSPVGTFSSLTGYTRALVFTDFDPDKTNFLAAQQTLTTDSVTEQFSQELRFMSDIEGPVQFIAGAQYWTERTSQFDSNLTLVGRGVNCFAADPFGPAPAAPAPVGIPFFAGIRPPANNCAPITGPLNSQDVSSFMDDYAANRVGTWVNRTVKHQSYYLDIEWKIVDTLSLVGEARYVDEDNAVTAPVTDGQNGPGTLFLCGTYGPCSPTQAAAAFIPGIYNPMGLSAAPVTRYVLSPTRNDSYVTPKGTLRWMPTENLNIYASYSAGQKPGGYSTITLGGTGMPLLAGQPDWAQISFEPEKIKVYELGSKWRGDNGRLLINGALFKQDFTDKQVGSQVLIGNVVSNRVLNASAAVLEGGEVSLQWRASQNWTLGGGLTFFSKYEYVDYKTPSTSPGEIARVGNCTVGYVDSSGFVPLGSNPIPFAPGSTTAFRALTCQVDRSGNHLEDTPELAAAFNIGYRRPVAIEGGEFFADLDANWTDRRFVEDDNSQWVDSYWLANLRLGLETKKWAATLFVDNLADDRTIRSAGTGPSIPESFFRLGVFTYQPAPTVTVPVLVPAPKFLNNAFADLPHPRTFGLRVSYKF